MLADCTRSGHKSKVLCCLACVTASLSGSSLMSSTNQEGKQQLAPVTVHSFLKSCRHSEVAKFGSILPVQRIKPGCLKVYFLTLERTWQPASCLYAKLGLQHPDSSSIFNTQTLTLLSIVSTHSQKESK